MCSSLCSDYLFKLLLIGDSGVGKSCLLLRFAVSHLSCFVFHVHFQFLVDVGLHCSTVLRVTVFLLGRLGTVLPLCAYIPCG